MDKKGPLGKGDDRALALAALFSIAAKDFTEIAELLQQVHTGSTVRSNSVLGKRKRPKKKKKTYWTNKELDFVEEALYKHIASGGSSEDVNIDLIDRGLDSRNKKEIEKQVDFYKRATLDDFKDLDFFKKYQKDKPKVKSEPMEVSPQKKKRRSSSSSKTASSQKKATTPKKKKISSSQS